MRIETTDLTQPMVGADIVLAQPRGFCAGVDRAIEIVERALQRHGAPIYVRHEIVHNKRFKLKPKNEIYRFSMQRVR